MPVQYQQDALRSKATPNPTPQKGAACQCMDGRGTGEPIRAWGRQKNGKLLFRRSRSVVHCWCNPAVGPELAPASFREGKKVAYILLNLLPSCPAPGPGQGGRTAGLRPAQHELPQPSRVHACVDGWVLGPRWPDVAGQLCKFWLSPQLGLQSLAEQRLCALPSGFHSLLTMGALDVGSALPCVHLATCCRPEPNPLSLLVLVRQAIPRGPAAPGPALLPLHSCRAAAAAQSTLPFL